MEIFEKVFNWLEGLSSKLPTINLKMYFIIVLAAIALVWVITAFTLLSSRSQRLIRASKKIRKYLADVDSVDDDNVSDFTALCFGSKAPQPLRDAWMQYLGVRFGYPSEIVSDQNVYDRLVKKHKDIRSGIYLAISLILLGLFAFWGYGTLDGIAMGVIHLAGLVLIAITYLLLIIFYRNQCKRCLEAFENMQDDLDAKVNLQIESNYATDSSPLSELNALVEEIIARNTAKVVELDENQGPTPIEELIEQTPELAEQPDEPLAEQIDDIAVEQTIVEESIEQQPVEEQPVIEEPVIEDTEPEQPEQSEPIVDVIADADNVDEPETVELEDLEELEDIEQEPEVQEPEVQESNEIDEVPLQEAEEPQDVENAQDTDEIELAEVEDQPDEEPVAVDEAELVEEPVEEHKAPKLRKSVVYDSAAGVGGVLSADYSMAAEADDDDEDEPVEEPAEEQEPEVVYVVDGDEDDEAIVKPAKLAKLPNLVDYMLTKNMSKAMKIQIATLLISTYKKFEHSKDDRAIVVQCLTKVMQALQK